MAISPSLSTAEVIIGTAGTVPDGVAVVTLRVTAKTTTGTAPEGITQVRVTPLVQGAQLFVDHEHVRPSFPETVFSYTDPTGRVDIPLRSMSAITTRYLVEIGEDDGVIPYSENGQLGKPAVDFPVGPQLQYTRTFTTDQTIDEAWLVTNNTFGGVTSRVVRNTLFAGAVSLAVTPAINQAPSIYFANCTFSTSPTTHNYSFVTNNIRFEALHCAWRGASVAGVLGEGGRYSRCVWDTMGRDGVRIEQSGSSVSGTGLPDDFTQSTFLSCLFRRVGVVTDGYCVRGTPMRNVVFDHVWFDVAHEDSQNPQTTPSGSVTPYGSCLGSVYQSTDVDGARGPRLFGCWIGGGDTAQITWAEGASNNAPQFGALRACRFDLTTAAPACEYLFDEMSTAAVPATQGNMDADGRLIDDAEVNRTAGALFLWPQVALTTQPEVTWEEAGTGPPGGGGGGGGGVGEGGGAGLGSDVIYTLRNAVDAPAGGGGGGTTVRVRRVTTAVQPAVPVLVGSVTAPPEEPLIVEWNSLVTTMEEGGQAVIQATLFTTNGGTPTAARLEGFTVPFLINYTGVGSTAGDFTIPASAVFGQGESVATVVVSAVNDPTTEGAENATITLTQVTGLNTEGDLVVKINPGTDIVHTVTILPSDPAPPVRQLFFLTNAVSQIEGSAAATLLRIWVRISGQPSGQAPFRATFGGTANLVGVATPADYTVLNGTPVAGNPSARDFVFQPTADGTTPTQLQIGLSILGDTIYENPDETITITLTSLDTSVAVVAAAPADVCTVTLVNDDQNPGMDPVVRWSETALSLREITGTSTPTNRVVEIRSAAAGNPFSVDTDVFVQLLGVGQTPALFPDDYDVLFDPPNNGTVTQGPGGELVGIVRFLAGQVTRTIVIQPENDGFSEPNEQFQLIILPGPGYTVDPANSTLSVTLLDPLEADTTLLTPRLTGLAQSIVSTSITLTGSATTAAGFTMSADGSDSTCQWHPLSYKPDGTPADVRLWALLPGSTASVPGQSTAISVRGGESSDPSAPIDLDTQYTTLNGNNLRLTLVHNVNGETRDFELDFGSPAAQAQCIDTDNVTTQGGGPRLFARRRVSGPLRAGSTNPGDQCTVARVYMDLRADMNAVSVAIHWGNYRWRKPTVTNGHALPNDYVDGEVFFDSLDLNGIPAGWAAVVLDTRTAVSEYDAGGSRVRIIKPLGGTVRNYVPPLKGHIAYVVLYETATVSAATALEILNGYDKAYSFGGLGMDRNDFLGEQGTPIYNPGQGDVPFFDQNFSGPQRYGFEGAANFAKRELDRIEAAITAGTSDILSGVTVARGWWHPFGDAAGGNPGGNRINLTGGVYPSKWRCRYTMLELVHLWNRVGMVPWDEKGEEVTDEDFCVTDGANLKSAVATWTGIGGQRMAHQHFYVPDFLTIVNGSSLSGGSVADSVKLGPGRKRARGSVTLAALPVANDDVVIADGNGVTHTFRFGTGVNTAFLFHVAIGTTISACATNLNTAIRTRESSTAFRVRSTVASTGVTLINYHAGVVGNAAITTTAPARITVVGMSGGLDTNANGAGVRLWNYLAPGSNSCPHNVHTDWHTKTMDGDYAFHTFDWPHMSRMNEATREGWWIHFDPIAHDCATGLMHLGTQCLMRYPEVRGSESIFIGQTPAVAQLWSSAAAANLALIRESHLGQYLRQYIQNDHDAQHPAAQFSARVASNGGLNCGKWQTRNPDRDVPGAASSPMRFNVSSDFTNTADWVIDRGWGWIMASVARGYAIEGVHRAEAGKDVERDRLHTVDAYGLGAANLASPRPSWFEMVRYCIQNTMHRSGAASSADTNGTASLYMVGSTGTGSGALGAPNFTARQGAVPGGDLNVPVDGPGGFGDDEWYANYIVWHGCYVALGAHAVGRRVYSWCDATTVPEVDLATNPWHLGLRGLWDFGRLLFLTARAQFGAAHFFVPTFSIVNSGDPALTGTATSTGQFGRFNTEAGASNPAITFRSTAGFWWTYGFGQGEHALNYYEVQYILWAWMNLRNYGPTDGFAAEILEIHPGLVGAGGPPLGTASGTLVSILMPAWQSLRLNEPQNPSGDSYGWAIQWHRNELGAT